MNRNIRLNAIRRLNPMPKSERSNYNLTDVKVGGYLSFDNHNWLVQDISRYLEVKWSNFNRKKSEDWTIELSILSLTTGEVHYLEYYVDDDIEVYMTTKEVKLRELGVTRSMLEEMAEEEEGEISYNGVTYYYNEDETWAALYYRGESKEGIPVRMYEFESSPGKNLTIEAWHDSVSDDRPEREAFLSQEFSVESIEILQLS